MKISTPFEIEVGFGTNYQNLDTVKLGIDRLINDRINGYLLLLHEDETKAPCSIDMSSDWSLIARQVYIPY